MTKFQAHFTPDEDVAIIDGHAAGLTWNEIVATLPGRTSRTVRMRAHRIGIHQSRKNSDEVPCPKKPTRDLLLALEDQFAIHARKWNVDYLDARTLLMNATSPVDNGGPSLAASSAREA